VKSSFAVKEDFTTMQHSNNHSSGFVMPHRRLVVYGRALELLAAVRSAKIADAKLRDEASRAAKGVCLNIAEASGRVSRADKARVVLRPLLGVAFAIARGECVECVAAVEIAAAAGDAVEPAAANAVQCGTEVYLMLGALVR
jgi:four helix bundle protein